MHFFTLAPRQVAILLPFLLSFPLNSVAQGYEPRGDGSDDGGCGDPAPTLDGATDDKSPGIGVEFETGQIQFTSKKNCNEEDTWAAKGKLVDNRKAPDDTWMLTADTIGDPDILNAEYILNGKLLKIGTGKAGPAAKAMAADLVAWKPTASDHDVTVKDNKCNPWKIQEAGAVDTLKWQPQVTVPLPLEAINDLFGQALKGATHPLLGKTNPGRGLTHVTKDFFQSKPNGMAADGVKDDLLGFLSLVMSYAKNARHFEDASSPKELTSIMPRTEFVTMYNMVKGQVKGDLYDLIEVLACYKNSGDKVEIDTGFCSGTVSKPVVTKGKMDEKVFGVSNQALSVQDWIKSIKNGQAPDKLTQLDKNVDGSIGGLNTAVEHVLQTTREVPLFEFRRLPGVKVSEMENLVTKAEQAVIDLHKKYANAPRKIKRDVNAKYSHIKRAAPGGACVTPAPTTPSKTTTPPKTTPKPAMPSCSLQQQDPDQGINKRGCVCGTTTLPLLTVKDATRDEQSCSYTALPSTKVANPITIATHTWTQNCQACTLVGGIADAEHCTSVPNCTPTATAKPFAIFLSNNSLPVGNEDNKDGGAALRKEVYDKLKALCPDNAKSCDSKKDAELKNIPTIVKGGIEYGTLKFTIQDSSYGSTSERDRMLAAAVSSWERSLSKSCEDVEYEYEADPTESGCGHGPADKRTLQARAEYQMRKRALEDLEQRSPKPMPICDMCLPPVEKCKDKARMCAGPDHINPVFAGKGGAYDNHMNIQLGFHFGQGGGDAFSKFICEAIIEGLTDLAMAVAPELVGPELVAELDFESLCADM
ncbi:hypothetical protein GQ43DRAFT_480789 [Delitschia confertaspora ATCC 74209]|uniref:Uncharacterized protein n=1 Tax=Delitschia confertaspora ATCC 74209 TaxID=1513339 RepID=A0A9P4MQ26_9PLEO|nr:hypothetical protein GQ43DRAFT_480789 [Delitschia confertaspora ATCC 74209]